MRLSRPVPETTDSFDLGLRYSLGRIEAQIGSYYTRYENRLATAFDPEADEGNGAFVYRNLGRVDKYGVDGSVAWRNQRIMRPAPRINTVGEHFREDTRQFYVC